MNSTNLRTPSDAAWAKPWRDYRKEIVENYGYALGLSVEELPTPILILDRTILDRNIEKMMSSLAGKTIDLRPHTKVQKSTDLALLQVAAGAVGVTVATVWEAAAMFAAGVKRVLIANEVIGVQKIEALALLAKHGDLTVVVDNLKNIEQISEQLSQKNTNVGVLIDLDVGMARCGARSLEEAVALADLVVSKENLNLEGLQAYEGHCMLEPDSVVRLKLATQAMDYAAKVLAAIQKKYPQAKTLSGGGTGTYNITGNHPAVTELQAGSYVFMDSFHGNLVPGFEVSLTVLSTVMARHGNTIILDAGRKSVGIDFVSPPVKGFDWVARYYAEEHALFDVDQSVTVQTGDKLEIISGYAPTTVNLHDAIFVIQEKKVVDIWPVFPRGPMDKGFLASLNKV
jgi:D-serine deaminase-like pyridoxal phosphate-dependent protein